MNIKEQIQMIEAAVKAGEFSEARAALGKINTRKIPRNLIEKTANLSFRTNLPNLSLRILGSFIADKRGLETTLSESETAEYAIALSRVGAASEAKLWLNSLSNQTQAKTILYKAFIHITQWEYAEALNLLRVYAERNDINDYQRLIAQTNIAACLIFLEQYEEAKRVLIDLVSTTQKEGHSLLLSNAYELSAQATFFLGDHESSKVHLSEGFAVAKPGSSAHLYLRKWETLLSLERANGKGSFEALKAVRTEAMKLGLWETIRECDFYMSRYQRNTELLSFVLFGTSHSSYKKRLLSLYRDDVSLPDEIVFALPFRRSRDIATVKSIFNLDTLEVTTAEDPIEKVGSLFHKTLLALGSDFYRPLRVGSIFTKLYPEEYYDPIHSPDRVHQVIKRVRKTLNKTLSGIHIEQSSGHYFLRSGKEVVFQKMREGQNLTNDERLLSLLKVNFKSKPFSLQEAKDVLNVSQTKTYYLIKPEVDKNLEKIGKGPGTKYKFVA